MPAVDSRKLFEQVEQALETQAFAPIYCCYGDEPYLVNQAVNYIKTCALHGIAADFNLSSYYAGDVEISLIRDEIETLPMMAQRRVMVLKDIQSFSEAEWDFLQAVLVNPVQTTVLILNGGKLDKRKKSFRLLSDNTQMVEFRKPFENQIPGWIRSIAKGLSLQISDEAVQLVHRLVGSHLSEIEVELLKLRDFLGERKNIETEDVAQVVTRRREDNVFDLAETLALGDRTRSFTCLADLLELGQSEVGIVALIARHIRILMKIKQGQQMGLQGVRLAQMSQVPQYFLQDYVTQAQRWTPRKLEQALLVLSDTDRALKSSPLSSHLWLENLILRTCALQQSSSTSLTV